MCRTHRTALALICLLMLTSFEVLAQPSEQYHLTQFALGRSQRSTDTTPVKIKVGYLMYHIPRNYMEYPDQEGPVLNVTYPGFKPFSEETRACFEQRLMSNGPAACRVIRFILRGSIGPGPGGRAFTTDEMFENFKRNTPGLAPPRSGSFGYQIYEMGPYPNHIEIYRREEGNIYFSCFMSDENDRDKGSVCNDLFILDDGNGVHAFLYPHQIGIVAEFEAAIRKIVAGFDREEVVR